LLSGTRGCIRCSSKIYCIRFVAVVPSHTIFVLFCTCTQLDVLRKYDGLTLAGIMKGEWRNFASNGPFYENISTHICSFSRSVTPHVSFSCPLSFLLSTRGVVLEYYRRLPTSSWLLQLAACTWYVKRDLIAEVARQSLLSGRSHVKEVSDRQIGISDTMCLSNMSSLK